MADPLFNRSAELDSPAWDAATVTPSNDADLPRAPTRAVYVGSDGSLEVVMAGGGTVTFSGLAAGTILPIRVDRVRATGTATGIVALY